MTLQDDFPWLEQPVVANAPMGGIAGPALAEAVTRARGLGLMGMVDIKANLNRWLDEVDQAFTKSPSKINNEDASTSLPYLPVGVGFLLFIAKVDTAVTVFRERHAQDKKPPALIWLFAADEPSQGVYVEWATALRSLFKEIGGYVPKIWIQVGGSAHAAVDLALSEARPDAIVIQGSDAGGHGLEKGASIVGLLPEVRDLLASKLNGEHGPHVLASGGIVDARGVLAALSLGADGVVMGTRFLASPETKVPHPEYRKRVLAARDGAMSTIRAKVFDELRGPNEWPVTYDGRALVSRSWKERYEENVPIETIRNGFSEAVKEKDGGYGVDSDRSVIWCGTGVGLVNESKAAGEVVEEVRAGVANLLRSVDARLKQRSAKI